MALLVFVFWPRHVMLPLADPDDKLLELYKELPCRDEFPSSTKAVLKFYDADGIPIKDRVYTVTPVSVHKGRVNNPDVVISTGWYWVANARIDWCGAAQQIKNATDYSFDAELNWNTLRFKNARMCLQDACVLS